MAKMPEMDMEMLELKTQTRIDAVLWLTDNYHDPGYVHWDLVERRVQTEVEHLMRQRQRLAAMQAMEAVAEPFRQFGVSLGQTTRVVQAAMRGLYEAFEEGYRG